MEPENKLAVLQRIFGSDLTDSVISNTLRENDNQFDPAVEKLLTLPSNKSQPQPTHPQQPQQPQLDGKARENIQRLHTMFGDLTQSVITTVYESNQRDVEGTVDTLLNLTSNEVASGARREAEIARQQQEIRSYEEYKKLQQRLQEEERRATEEAQRAAMRKAKEDEERRKKEEEAHKRAEFEAKRREEHAQALMEQERLLQEFQRKKAEEDEKVRRAKEAARVEEERKRFEMIALSEMKRVEEEKKRLEEEKRKVQEKQRLLEEEKRLVEEKKRAEVEAQRRLEEEKQRKLEKQAEDERKRQEEFLQAERRNLMRKMEEEKQLLREQKERAEAERKLIEERMKAEMLREGEERKRYEESEKRFREEQESIRRSWEEKIKQMESERRQEEQRRRQEEVLRQEKKLQEEEDRLRKEADMRRVLELERLKLEEQRRRVEEEKKTAEERLKAMELAARKREEEEEHRKKMEEERKREEEERIRLLEEETQARERMKEEMAKVAAQEQFAASAVLVTPAVDEPKVDLQATAEGTEIKGTWTLARGVLPSTAWLGLYPRRSINSYVGFLYLSGTSGEFHFKGLTPGHYEARVFSNKLVTSRIAETAPLRVGPSVSRFSVQQQGDQLMFEYSLDPPSNPTSWDWVGIFEKSQRRNKQYLTSVYGNTAGSVTAPLPRTPGVYEARLFAAGSKYNEQACVEFIVEDNDCVDAPNTVAIGTPIHASWIMRTVEPSSSDWIGLFRGDEQNNSKYLSSAYTHSSASSGVVDIALPKDIAPGVYELRLFSSKIGKYTTFKSSGPIYVTN